MRELIRLCGRKGGMLVCHRGFRTAAFNICSAVGADDAWRIADKAAWNAARDVLKGRAEEELLTWGTPGVDEGMEATVTWLARGWIN